MSDTLMTAGGNSAVAVRSGRLSIWSAALVVARRDFTAVLFSRTFLFFLLGPLFPIVIGVLAGSVGSRVEQSVVSSQIGLALNASDTKAFIATRAAFQKKLGEPLPDVVVVKTVGEGEVLDPAKALSRQNKNIDVLLSGSLAAPVLTGPKDKIEAWQASVAMIAAQADAGALYAWPVVQLQPVTAHQGNGREGRIRTAQGAQTLLFLLTMMLAGMVLSNLVEEKSNKIIEVLAAAVPMEAVFIGKLFAMLGVSLVGIATWAAIGGAFSLSAQNAFSSLPDPAVGWPLLIFLGVSYFAMAYLLLGAVFLAIGALASTVREVQTLSMPVTMMQLVLFFFTTYAMTQPGSMMEWGAMIFPFSSPFSMVARAAQYPNLLPHVLALLWQGVWVFILVRLGARLFRKRVLKSGTGQPRAQFWRKIR